MASEEPVDTSESYDAKHGKRSDAEEQHPSGLTEASNKPPVQEVAFKNLSTK
jgi:hypothetical protein